jgi:threonylcarbamoyladenosine tRNA methylthiotransferase MtaB
VKERAARLREAGDRAYRAHLDRTIGSRQSILVEHDGIGRTEGFTMATIDAGAPGEIVEAIIAGHDGMRLTACVPAAEAA